MPRVDFLDPGALSGCMQSNRVRYRQLEDYVLAYMKKEADRGQKIDRKIALSYARKWTKQPDYGPQHLKDKFRASKGWADKFMIRNQDLLASWTSFYRNANTETKNGENTSRQGKGQSENCLASTNFEHLL